MLCVVEQWQTASFAFGPAPMQKWRATGLSKATARLSHNDIDKQLTTRTRRLQVAYLSGHGAAVVYAGKPARRDAIALAPKANDRHD